MYITLSQYDDEILECVKHFVQGLAHSRYPTSDL